MEQEMLKLILVEMREMKGDMSEVKNKLTILDNRVGHLESDMSEVKVRLTNLETDMTEVKGRLTNLETDMTEVKGRLKRVEELSEFNYDTCQTIVNVCEEHFKEFKQFIKKNNEDHQRYNSKILNYRVEEDDE